MKPLQGGKSYAEATEEFFNAARGNGLRSPPAARNTRTRENPRPENSSDPKETKKLQKKDNTSAKRKGLSVEIRKRP